MKWEVEHDALYNFPAYVNEARAALIEAIELWFMDDLGYWPVI